MSQEITPKYGGRNVVAAHGAVTENFSRHFVVGGTGATISAITFNGGTTLTAPQLAALGLDQPIAAGTPCYLGKHGDYISSITFSAGGAFMHYQSADDWPI